MKRDIGSGINGRSSTLVAIGGGFAGLVAALRGAELGLRTAVVEKGDDARYPCSSRWAGGIFHVSYHDMRLPPARADRGDRRADRRARPTRARGGGGRGCAAASSIGWQRKARISPAPARSPGTAGPWRRRAPQVAGQDWQGRGPDLMLARAAAAARTAPGPDAARVPAAAALRVEGGRCTGLMARRDGAELRSSARAVVIADGGFPGDPELFRRHIGPRPDRVLQRHAGTRASATASAWRKQPAPP